MKSRLYKALWILLIVVAVVGVSAILLMRGSNQEAEEIPFTYTLANSTAKLSSSTAAKYLGLLEKDGKVAMREQRPFKFWKLRVKKEEEK